MTDFETVDFFTDESLVPDPYPYFDHLRSKCPVTQATPFNVLAVTGYDEALAVYKDSGVLVVHTRWRARSRGCRSARRRRCLRADRGTPRRSPDERAHHVAGSAAAHENPRAAEQAHHSQAPQGERRLHVAAGRRAARHVHRPRLSASSSRTTRSRSRSWSSPICSACPPRTTTSSVPSSPASRSAHLGEESPTSHNPLQWLNDKFYAYIEDRRRAPRGDVLTELAQAKYEDGSTPDIEDVMNLSTFLFAAGTETTTKLVSSAMRIIAENPEYESVSARGPQPHSGAFSRRRCGWRARSSRTSGWRARRRPIGDDRGTRRHDGDGAAGRMQPGRAKVRRSGHLPPRPSQRARADRVHPRRSLVSWRTAGADRGPDLAEPDSRPDDRLRGSPRSTTAAEEARRYSYEPTFIMRGLTELHVEFKPIP